MRLDNCHNFHDFRALAKRRLPGPIFDYIDGAADDEATLRQNTASFERCDLVPNVLRGVGTIDMSVTVMGDTDLTMMRAFFIKPASTITIGFSDDPLLGMSTDHFSGSATARLEMTSFTLRTALLR